jgi:hypothetical protein
MQRTAKSYVFSRTCKQTRRIFIWENLLFFWSNDDEILGGSSSNWFKIFYVVISTFSYIQKQNLACGLYYKTFYGRN